MSHKVASRVEAFQKIFTNLYSQATSQYMVSVQLHGHLVAVWITWPIIWQPHVLFSAYRYLPWFLALLPFLLSKKKKHWRSSCKGCLLSQPASETLNMCSVYRELWSSGSNCVYFPCLLWKAKPCWPHDPPTAQFFFASTNSKKYQLHPLKLHWPFSLPSSIGDLESFRKTLQTSAWTGRYKEPRECSGGGGCSNSNSKNERLDVALLTRFSRGDLY